VFGILDFPGGDGTEVTGRRAKLAAPGDQAWRQPARGWRVARASLGQSQVVEARIRENPAFTGTFRQRLQPHEKSRGIARLFSRGTALLKPEGLSLGLKNQTRRVESPEKPLISLVGSAGFEPATPGL
jgi:hypothetical protein